MKISSLFDEHHVSRQVPFQLVDIDDDTGVVRGIFPQAFELRADEDYLSAGWLEYFSGSKMVQVAGVAAYLSSTRKVTAKQVFACGAVGDVKDACLDHGQKIRVLHEPSDENAAYVAVRRYKSDNQDLLDLLATEAWSDLVEAKLIVDLVGPWPK